MANIVFGPSAGNTLEIGRHRVYTRTEWKDAWIEEEHLHCLECSWTFAPTLPVATLLWEYGMIRQIGESEFNKVEAIAFRDRFVKIEFETERDDDGDWQHRNWYGIVRVDEESLLGNAERAERIASGQQLLHCAGLETLLQQELRFTYWTKDGSGEEDPRRSLILVAFNSRGVGNRSSDQFNEAYVFDDDREAETWSSRQMVKHLLAHQGPRNNDDEIKIPFQLNTDSESNLADWDKPELPTERRTTFSLLNQLIDRRRMLVWWLDVVETEDFVTTDEVELHVGTLTDEDITFGLPGSEPIPANKNVNRWIFEKDELTNAAIKESGLPIVEQVVARGERLRCVGTFDVSHATIEIGWTETLEDEYELGAQSADPLYAQLGWRDRALRDAEVRHQPHLADVYARFRIPNQWNGEVGDGDKAVPLFPEQLDFPLMSRELVFEQTLPLLVGVDYSGTAKLVDESSVPPPRHDHEMRPLVVFKKPNVAGAPFAEDSWINAEHAASAADLEEEHDPEELQLACHVYVDGASLIVKVAGRPQHIIAGDAFAALAADTAKGVYDYSGGKMKATLSIRGPYTEGTWPPKMLLNDAVRRKYLYVGQHATESFHQTYIADGTVVGINSDGKLRTSSGGYIPDTASSDDPGQRLEAIAKAAGKWYLEPHRVVTLRTRRLKSTSDIAIGHYVKEVGEEGHPHQRIVGGVVSSITIKTPRPRPDSRQAPEMIVQTWAGELDALQAIPKLPDFPLSHSVVGGLPLADADLRPDSIHHGGSSPHPFFLGE